MSETETYSQRFSAYFDRPVAQKAAQSLSDGSEIELRVGLETLTLTRKNKLNLVLPSPARSPQLIFTVPTEAANEILADSSEDIGAIGVKIVHLVLSGVGGDPHHKITLQLKTGFFGLLTHGYFGILTTGGSQIASELASRGLDGIAAIRAALKKMKS